MARVYDSRKRVLVTGGAGFLGVTFKPNTDDMRDAPALTIVPLLQASGARVRAHDPEGMPIARSQLDNVLWCDGPYHVAEGSDALVILTEWDAYRALDLARIKELMRGSTVIDLRNVYRPDEIEAASLTYLGIGRSAATRFADPNLHLEAAE